MDLSPSHPSSDKKRLMLLSKHMLGRQAKCSALSPVETCILYKVAGL